MSDDHHHHHGDMSHLHEMDARVKALESLLVEKGYVESAAIDELVDIYENRIGPKNGAHVIAKAWTEPEFADWLREDATAAIHSLGYTSRQGEHMVAVFNDDEVHHLVVCTLCSCYPWSVLGLPPTWYKSPPFRSRAVIDPRGVLADFSLELPETTRVEVHDSTAEVRYLVIPQRPDGTDGMSADQLAELVSRNSMIGTAFADNPQ
ncbi:MAG: nitrile hydratase subunit alpha [Rhizobiaceae bacterium]|nr:nitrile hydratase subunit alpha [Hyphomicrobiales bacterium]NRB29590.1 nitrile hydratase subunit alpha [Rhizobiaceae bacterium]